MLTECVDKLTLSCSRKIRQIINKAIQDLPLAHLLCKAQNEKGASGGINNTSSA
jgi:hypothetical protein